MEDSSSLVQLGHIKDVPQLHLEGPGTLGLESLMAGGDTSRAVRSALDRLPTDGWRLLKVAFGGGRHKEVWGCPDNSGWWVLTVTHVRGARHILVTPDPVEPLPSRDGTHLALIWSKDVATVPQSELLQRGFELQLTNTSTSQWANTSNGSDSVLVVPVGIGGYDTDVGSVRLPDIPAGSSYHLTGYLSRPLPPGTYELRADMPDLQLRTLKLLTLSVTA